MSSFIFHESFKGTPFFKVLIIWTDGYIRRTPTTIYVRESHTEKMGKVEDVAYEILNVLEFNRY